MPNVVPLIKLVQVCKQFSGAEGAPAVKVLQNANLEVMPGEALAIIGPSGSGKSTLLNLLGTLDQPESGKVWFENQDLSTLGERELAEFRNRKIGFVFQSHHLLPHCTVWENVLVPTLASSAGKPDEAAGQRAERLLKRVGLAERLHHRPAQLSGGERQRVAVVRALINQPVLLLADEPTGALDRQSATELSRLLVELNQEEKVTLILVTHSQDLARLMQRVLELRDGQLAPVRMN